MPDNWTYVTEKNGEFPVEAGRYHIYSSPGCPFAHRVLIALKFKGLEDAISVSSVHPMRCDKGWSFHAPVNVGTTADGFQSLDWQDDKFGEDRFTPDIGDPVNHKNYLRELYFAVDPEYKGRFTVPTLWDKKKHTIVNNESADIVRILNEHWGDLATANKDVDLYPEALRADIDAANDRVAKVQVAGFQAQRASTQDEYEKAYDAAEAAFHDFDAFLKGKTFLVGNQITEADIRAYVVFIRHDPSGYFLSKLNFGRIRDFPNINRWLKNLYYNYPAFGETTNFDHIKAIGFGTYTALNPSRIYPKGPRENIEPK